MAVVLTREQEQTVQKLLEDGSYDSSQAVLEEALHLVTQISALRQDIKAGLDSLDQGSYSEYSSETLQDHLEAIRQRNHARLAE